MTEDQLEEYESNVVDMVKLLEDQKRDVMKFEPSHKLSTQNLMILLEHDISAIKNRHKLIKEEYKKREAPGYSNPND